MAKDLGEVIKWFCKSAEQGKSEAEYGLGSLYDRGEGVPRDLGQALTWLRQAAAQGNPGAQGCLGLMYALGDGVPRDPVEAYALLLRASDGGDEPAARGFHAIERTLSPAQAEAGQRRALALPLP